MTYNDCYDMHPNKYFQIGEGEINDPKSPKLLYGHKISLENPKNIGGKSLQKHDHEKTIFFIETWQQYYLNVKHPVF